MSFFSGSSKLTCDVTGLDFTNIDEEKTNGSAYTSGLPPGAIIRHVCKAPSQFPVKDVIYFTHLFFIPRTAHVISTTSAQMRRSGKSRTMPTQSFPIAFVMCQFDCRRLFNTFSRSLRRRQRTTMHRCTKRRARVLLRL